MVEVWDFIKRFLFWCLMAALTGAVIGAGKAIANIIINS